MCSGNFPAWAKPDPATPERPPLSTPINQEQYTKPRPTAMVPSDVPRGVPRRDPRVAARLGRPLHPPPGQPTRAITSISTSTPFGNPATATVARAGRWSPKCLAYTAFMSANRAMSDRYTVVLTTVRRLPPPRRQHRRQVREHPVGLFRDVPFHQRPRPGIDRDLPRGEDPAIGHDGLGIGSPGLRGRRPCERGRYRPCAFSCVEVRRATDNSDGTGTAESSREVRAGGSARAAAGRSRRLAGRARGSAVTGSSNPRARRPRPSPCPRRSDRSRRAAGSRRPSARFGENRTRARSRCPPGASVPP